MEKKKAIVSLCDYSGNWSKPFLKHGYTVIQVDPDLYIRKDSEKEPENVIWVSSTAQQFRDYLREFEFEFEVIGILMAPPCTDFTVSGARWWADKDRDGRTIASLEIIDACLEIKDILNPEWWVLENPVGRLPKLRPDALGSPEMYFQPCEFGDAYTKKTGLWGNFNTNLKRNPVAPVWYYDSKGNRGSWMWKKLGGASAKTKRLRSHTPEGFSEAFAEAQIKENKK